MSTTGGLKAGSWTPRVDIYEEEGELRVRTEIAGVDPDTVEVTVDDRVLTISGSRSFTADDNDRRFHRREKRGPH